MEKLLNGNAQAIAELFDRGDRSAAVAPAHDVIDRRLRYAAEAAQLIDRDVPFPAQFQDPLFHCFPYVQRTSPLSLEKGYPFPLEKITSFELI